MAFTTATATNRVIEQGNTYDFTVEPAQQQATIRATAQGSEYTVGERVLVTQWLATARFSKRYRYVGMTKAKAEELALAIADDYIVDMPRYALGIYIDTDRGISIYKFLPIEGGDVPTCCATVTPTHGEGPLWNIEVDVDAQIEKYFDSVPSASTIKGLFSSIANFPES